MSAGDAFPPASAAVALAFIAGVCAVAGAWDALALVERARVLRAVDRALAPVVRAGREGRAPTAPERRRLALLAAAALAAAGWFVAGPVGAGAAAVAGPALAVGAVRARRRRYAAELRRAAPAVARSLADALAAGRSVRGAVAAAAAGSAGPAAHELSGAARALQLGEGTDAVLERLRRRARCAAWNAMVAGILLQRDAGGDLAALLRDFADALEEAARQERDARAATAQARFTARVVVALPAGGAILAELASPGFTAGLFAQPLPATLTAIALALQTVALLAVHRLGRVIA